MRSFIVASVLVALLMLFVATVTDVSHDAAETETVLTVDAECPSNLAGCVHDVLASNYDSGFCEALAAEAVLKLPSEGTVSRTKHDYCDNMHSLKTALHMRRARHDMHGLTKNRYVLKLVRRVEQCNDANSTAILKGHFSVGVLPYL